MISQFLLPLILGSLALLAWWLALPMRNKQLARLCIDQTVPLGRRFDLLAQAGLNQGSVADLRAWRGGGQSLAEAPAAVLRVLELCATKGLTRGAQVNELRSGGAALGPDQALCFALTVDRSETLEVVAFVATV